MRRSRRTTVLSAVALAAALALQGLAPSSVRAAAGPELPGRYIVVLDDTTSADPAALAGRQLRALGRAPVPRAVFRHALKGYAADLTPAQAAELRRAPGIRFVAPERTYRHTTEQGRSTGRAARAAGPGGEAAAPASPPCRTATDITRRQCLPEWADRIEADRSSARSGDGRGSVTGVNVAVIDSGITGGHPDLNVRGGTDCVAGQPVVPGGSLSDPLLIGTAMAGVIGARDNRLGIVGVAPGTPLWSYKVFPDDGDVATDAAVLCSLDRVAATRTDTDPGNDIQVATVGFFKWDLTPADDGACGADNQDALHQAVCALTGAGVTLVAPAGRVRYDIDLIVPAAYDEVLAATTMADFDGRPGGRAAADCRGTDLGGSGIVDDQIALPEAGFARSDADRRHLVAAPGVCLAATGAVADPLPRLTTGAPAVAAVATGVTALCIAGRKCPADDPATTVRTIVGDATRHHLRHPEYGYYGDPRHPVRGRFYGPLLTAGLY
ncbi:S8 family serine peptidase [Streptomyces sp. NPDC057494]|uniref:S8 family serine peptidase n=1 Tax=Streptomyces sp. NPDC057494 TaxID=3346148 RepID=UPI0036815A19